jgi:hypothetical protein
MDVDNCPTPTWRSVSFDRSLGDILEGRSSSHREFAVSEYDGHTCVVTKSLKVEFDRARRPVLAFDRRL